MDRKEIIKILGEHFGVKAKYMGAPSFAYQIITAEGVTYIIDRKGNIKNAEGTEFELESLLEDNKADPTEENLREEISLSMDGHTGVTLRNLVNIINSKQSLIKKALKIETDIVTSEFVESINIKIVTIEDFKAALENIGIEKVPGIRFGFQEKSISFDFIRDFEDIEAAIQFAKALNENAKILKQSSPKPTITDNEKFTFRTFLVRLGFVGPGYKKAREVLLKNLEGNGAFRKGKPDANH